MAPPADPDALSPVELRALVSALQGKVVDLERTVAAQRGDRPPQGSEGAPADQAERHGAGERAEAAARPAWSSRPRQGGATGRRRGPGCRGLRAARLAVPGPPGLPGPGPRVADRGGPLPPRALADAGGAAGRGALAGRG